MTNEIHKCIIDPYDKQHIIKGLDEAIKDIKKQKMSQESKDDLIKEYTITKKKIENIKPCYETGGRFG